MEKTCDTSITRLSVELMMVFVIINMHVHVML